MESLRIETHPLDRRHTLLRLREQFRRRRALERYTVSPSAQALLIQAVLRWDGEDRSWPRVPSIEMGYSVKTVSRAINELKKTGLIKACAVGRTRVFKRKLSARETWECARPMLSNPVKDTGWSSLPSGTQMPRAGWSALAHEPGVVDPAYPVYAATLLRWKAMRDNGFLDAQSGDHELCAVQIWSYRPTLNSDDDVVDPLSLALSLQDDPNPRVQQALDALQAIVLIKAITR